jgi:hypothetical protein
LIIFNNKNWKKYYIIINIYIFKIKIFKKIFRYNGINKLKPNIGYRILKFLQKINGVRPYKKFVRIRKKSNYGNKRYILGWKKMLFSFWIIRRFEKIDIIFQRW